MIKPNKFIISAILATLVLLLSYQVRHHLYQQIPFPGESTDEYSNSWVGLSLIRLGFPVGISGLAGGYPTTDHRYINVDRILQSTANGTPVSLNSPWFDHPPFVGLITGSFAYLKGARVFEDTTIALIRKPLVLIGALSASLVFVYASLLFGPLAGLLSGLVYAFSPLIIVSSRLVQAENFIIPVFLLSLIFQFLYQKTKKPHFFYLSALTAGSSLLFKLSGLAVILANLILLAKDKRAAFFYGLISLSFLLIYFVFGLAYDPAIFRQVFTGNTNRIYGIGTNAIQQLITTSKITNIRYFTDGWYLAGWLSFFALTVIRPLKRNRFIIIPLVSYLIIYLFFGSHPFGWYSFPFLPFLAISLGSLVTKAIKNPRLTPLLTLILIIPTGVALSKLYSSEAFVKFLNYWRFGLVFSLLLSLVPNRLISRLLILSLFALALFTGYLYFNSLTIDTWYHVN